MGTNFLGYVDSFHPEKSSGGGSNHLTLQKMLNFLTWIVYRKCTGNANSTFPVLFLDRSCTQYMPYDQPHFLHAGNVTYPVLFLHKSCTQYMPYDQSHFLYAGNGAYPVLFLHKSCTQYMPYDSHTSFMQGMSHILYYFCTDPVHSTCHNYDQAHFYYAGNAIFPVV